MKLRIRKDWAYYVLIAMVWCHTILLQYVRAVIMRVPYIGQYPDAGMALLYIVVIALARRDLLFSKIDLIVLNTILVVYCLSPIFHPDTIPYWQKDAMRFFCYVIPFYMVGTSIIKKRNSQQIMKWLYILSCITITIKMLDKFMFGSPMSEIQSLYKGDMDLAYKLVPHLCVVLYFMIKKTNVVNMIFAAIGMVFLTFLGTRGAVLIVAVCAVVLLCLLAEWKHKKIKITALALAGGGFLFSPWFIKTVELMQQIAKKMGLSVRIFDKLLKADITNSSGRSTLADQLHDALNQGHIFGYGLYGDRVLLDTYAHKLHLEFWIDFGYVVGTLLLIALALLIIKAYRKTKSTDEKALILILCCVGVFKLFLSSSYLREPMLFMLLGVCIAVIKSKERTDPGNCLEHRL